MKSILVILAVSLSVSSAFAQSVDSNPVLPQAPLCDLDRIDVTMSQLYDAPAAPRSPEYTEKVVAAFNQLGDVVHNGREGNLDFSETAAIINADHSMVVDAEKCSNPAWKYSLVFLKLKSRDGKIQKFDVRGFRVDVNAIPAFF